MEVGGWYAIRAYSYVCKPKCGSTLLATVEEYASYVLDIANTIVLHLPMKGATVMR